MLHFFKYEKISHLIFHQKKENEGMRPKKDACNFAHPNHNQYNQLINFQKI